MIRSVDEDGNTPLHLACCHGYEEVALYLINNQADIGARYYNSIARCTTIYFNYHCYNCDQLCMGLSFIG